MREAWIETTLGEASELVMGQSPPGSSYNTTGQGLPFIQGSAEFGAHHPVPLKWCSDPRKVAAPGDVLLSVRAPVGDTNVANQKIAIGRGLAIVRGRAGHVTSAYLRLALEYGASEMLARSGGGMFTSITGAALRSLPLVLPPIPEQARIVDLIGAADDSISAAETMEQRLGTALAARRESIFGVGAQRPANEAFDILIGLQRSPARAEGPSQTRYLRSANVTHGRLILDDVKSMSFDEKQQRKYRLKPGDVLVSEGSASASAVGAPSKFQGELDGVICFQNTLLRYRAVEGVTTPEFTSQWCSWAYESGAFRDAANGTNIKHIGSRGAAKMGVADIPFEEQPGLTEQLHAAQVAVDRARASIAALRTLRSDLLTVLLSRDHEIPASYDAMLEATI